MPTSVSVRSGNRAEVAAAGCSVSQLRPDCAQREQSGNHDPTPCPPTGGLSHCVQIMGSHETIFMDFEMAVLFWPFS